MWSFFLATLMAMTVVLTTPEAMAFSASQDTFPPCRADRVALRIDGGNREFDGMSLSGMSLELQSRSAGTCMLAALPVLRFQDASRQNMAAAPRSSRGMHPGPVVLPIRLSPDQTVVSEVRWVSGDVYDQGRGIQPAYVGIAIDGKTIWTTFHGQLYGPREAGPTYRATRFAPRSGRTGQRPL
jgi:hypothetical protein